MRLTIGVIPTVTAIGVPVALRRFRERHPRCASRSATAQDDALPDQAGRGLD
ncbi:hypothetical protein [Microtetraspora niveoalba]|uniref:hypothetical protein n=1 Tax=Microtetraspora niveoalba TaxID=46175 RepID=UPI000AEABE24|nr:hypothetical protein [Microtetraspora niveoalba]